jgi:hypothetical protein
MATERYKNVNMQRKTGDNKILTALLFLFCVFYFSFLLVLRHFLYQVPLPGNWTSKNVASN